MLLIRPFSLTIVKRKPMEMATKQENNILIFQK